MPKRLRQAESREATRRHLLAAATELFGRHGYEATSVEDVSEAAGYSKGAFYYNFGSKEELLSALVTEWIEELTGSLQEALAGAQTIEDKLEAAQDVLAERERARSGHHLELEILLRALRDDKLRGPVADAYGRMRSAVASLIDEQFLRAGVEPPMDPDALATVLLGALAGVKILRGIDPEAAPPGVLAAMTRLMLRPQPER